LSIFGHFAGLKESAKERRRFIRNAGDFVRCLTIEFEIELGLGSTVVPVVVGDDKLHLETENLTPNEKAEESDKGRVT
jgi:hypothetical protein